MASLGWFVNKAEERKEEDEALARVVGASDHRPREEPEEAEEEEDGERSLLRDYVPGIRRAMAILDESQKRSPLFDAGESKAELQLLLTPVLPKRAGGVVVRSADVVQLVRTHGAMQHALVARHARIVVNAMSLLLATQRLVVIQCADGMLRAALACVRDTEMTAAERAERMDMPHADPAPDPADASVRNALTGAAIAMLTKLVHTQCTRVPVGDAATDTIRVDPVDLPGSPSSDWLGGTLAVAASAIQSLDPQASSAQATHDRDFRTASVAQSALAKARVHAERVAVAYADALNADLPSAIPSLSKSSTDTVRTAGESLVMDLLGVRLIRRTDDDMKETYFVHEAGTGMDPASTATVFIDRSQTVHDPTADYKLRNLKRMIVMADDPTAAHVRPIERTADESTAEYRLRLVKQMNKIADETTVAYNLRLIERMNMMADDVTTAAARSITAALVRQSCVGYAIGKLVDAMDKEERKRLRLEVHEGLLQRPGHPPEPGSACVFVLSSRSVGEILRQSGITNEQVRRVAGMVGSGVTEEQVRRAIAISQRKNAWQAWDRVVRAHVDMCGRELPPPPPADAPPVFRAAYDELTLAAGGKSLLYTGPRVEVLEHLAAFRRPVHAVTRETGAVKRSASPAPMEVDACDPKSKVARAAEAIVGNEEEEEVMEITIDDDEWEPRKDDNDEGWDVPPETEEQRAARLEDEKRRAERAAREAIEEEEARKKRLVDHTWSREYQARVAKVKTEIYTARAEADQQTRQEEEDAMLAQMLQDEENQGW